MTQNEATYEKTTIQPLRRGALGYRHRADRDLHILAAVLLLAIAMGIGVTL